VEILEEERKIETNMRNAILNMDIDQDSAILQILLRTQLYSDPHGSAMREIASNSRDAHREVGCEKPIRIFFPSKSNPQIVFQDYGPGLSPERINNIYKTYFGSTKRGSNIQTGGFGLGSKSPLAITDTFGIVTVNDGVKYNYLVSVGENNKGDIILLGEELTGEGNGTTVKIPIQEDKIQYCSDYIYNCTRMWEPQPEYIGYSKKGDVPKVTISGDGWAIYEKYPGTCILLDGIPYNCNNKEILNNLPHSNFCFILKTGEVEVSLSRESLYFSEKTNGKLKNILDEFSLIIKDKIQSELDACDDLFKLLKRVNEFENGAHGYKSVRIDYSYMGTPLNLNSSPDSISVIVSEKDGQKRCSYSNLAYDYNRYDQFKIILIDYDKLTYEYPHTYRPNEIIKIQSYMPTNATKNRIRGKLLKDNIDKLILLSPESGLFNLIKIYFPQNFTWMKDFCKISHKVPKTKRKNLIPVYPGGGHYASKIDLDDTTIKYIWENKSRYGGQKEIYEIAKTLGYTYVEISNKFVPRIRLNPNFITVDQFYKKELVENIGRERLEKIILSIDFSYKHDHRLALLVDAKYNEYIEWKKNNSDIEKYFPLIELYFKKTNWNIGSSAIRLDFSKYPMLQFILKEPLSDESLKAVEEYIKLVNKGKKK
jgi:hypothetical protein